MTDKNQEFTDAIKPPDQPKEDEQSDDLVKNLSKDVETRYVEIVKDNARKEEFPISGKIWKRRKITHKEFKDITTLRKQLLKINKNKDPELWESKHEEFYKAFARCSLVNKDTNQQMTDDDYDNSEAGEIERIIDGINFRISYGIPSVA